MLSLHQGRYQDYFSKKSKTCQKNAKADERKHEKVNRYKAQLVYDPALNGYIHKSWQRFHAWLLASLEAREGLVETKVSRWLQELGISLTENSDLSQAFNTHIGEAAKYMAPELADFLTRHIRDTINSWDERSTPSTLYFFLTVFW